MLLKNVPAALLACAGLAFAVGACGAAEEPAAPEEAPAETAPAETPAETADVAYKCAMDGCDKTKTAAADADAPSC